MMGTASGFMLLVLQGEVTVESAPLVPGEAVTIHFTRPAWIDQLDASWRDFLHRAKERSQKP